MSDVLKVENEKILNSLQNHEDGEITFLEDIQEYRMYKDGRWIPIKAEVETGEGLKMSLYDINKMQFDQTPLYEEQNYKDAEDTLTYWKEKFSESNSFLMYGRDADYFSLFQCNRDFPEFYNFSNAVITVLKESFEGVYSIEVVGENSEAVEIWVKYQGGPIVLYLFDYSTGIITYGD